MERLASEHIVSRALSVMVADAQSPLDRDERAAILCWLQGLPCQVLILLPDDIAEPLLAYIVTKHPEMTAELAQYLQVPHTLIPSSALTDSPLEVEFFLAWHEEALDVLFPLTMQYPVKDGRYRLDFAFPPLKVGIELDGYTYHSDRESFTRDRQRQREIEAQGWRIMRFSGAEIRADVTRCVHEAAHFLSIQQFRQQTMLREEI